jgi:soluble lytic murein transglycosylase
LSKHSDKTKTKAKIWTVTCLILVCAAAILLRGVFVYKVYPLKYEDLIIKYSTEYAIDEHLVCAVISAESSFKETALSSSGAMGLMQIMPDTGGWIAEKLDMTEFETGMLYDPETNIKLGCWYLNYLNGLFSGDARKVLAAYNAGPSRVKEWLDADGVLKDIPYKETDNYIIKIEKNYEIYKALYADF